MLEHGQPGYRHTTWPDAYAELLPAVREEWKIAGDIHLIRRLGGGKSGALVYSVDITTEGYSGQAILKLDHARFAEDEELNEAKRHIRAFETTPGFASKHLPQVLHMTSKGEQLAILSSIAEVGLEYSAPWFDFDYDTQLDSAKIVSRDILESWNAGYMLSDRLVMPKTILHSWMGYRLDPKQSRIFDFLDHGDQSRAHAQFGPDDQSFMFNGEWFPNPLFFALAQDLPHRLQLRAAMGCHHGDLHGDNLLIAKTEKRRPHYYLIDLAFYDPQQYLFYDHAYFELAYLLRIRPTAAAREWLAILNALDETGTPRRRPILSADDVGPTGLLRAWRKSWSDWMHRQEGGRRSFMESQMLLARVASGLTFAHRTLAEPSRHMAFIHAAHALKSYLALNGVDWPRSGPAYERGFENTEAVSSDVAASHSDSDLAAAVPGRRGRGARAGALTGNLKVELIPFEFLGDGEDRDRLTHGLSMELLSRMSRIDWISVVPTSVDGGGRTSPIPVHGAGFGYLITGSVRRAGNQLRVTAYLIEETTDECIWSRQYDREIGDVLALQDEISEDIVDNLDSQLKYSELKRAGSGEAPSGLWNVFQNGRLHYFTDSLDGSDKAIGLFRQVLEMDPGFAPAHAWLALSQLRGVAIGSSRNPNERIEAAREHAQDAVMADNGSSIAHMAMGRVCTMAGEFEQADWELRRAVELNPSSASTFLARAALMQWRGDARGALDWLTGSSHFSAVGPLLQVRMLLEASNLYFLDAFEKAHAVARPAVVGHMAGPIGYEVLAVCSLRCGRDDEARAAMAKATGMAPRLTAERVAKCWHAMAKDLRQRFLDDLRGCGLPDSDDQSS